MRAANHDYEWSSYNQNNRHRPSGITAGERLEAGAASASSSPLCSLPSVYCSQHGQYNGIWLESTHGSVCIIERNSRTGESH